MGGYQIVSFGLTISLSETQDEPWYTWDRYRSHNHSWSTPRSPPRRACVRYANNTASKTPGACCSTLRLLTKIALSKRGTKRSRLPSRERKAFDRST